jgi:hypothetical protein
MPIAEAVGSRPDTTITMPLPSHGFDKCAIKLVMRGGWALIGLVLSALKSVSPVSATTFPIDCKSNRWPRKRA